MDPFWGREARRLAWSASFGWWLEAFAPAFAVLGALDAALILALREGGRGVGGGVLLGAAGVVAIGIRAYVRARPRFLEVPDALAELDWRLRLDNQLSSALAGVGAWPSPSRWRPVVTWRLRGAGLPVAAGLAIVALALRVPTPDSDRNVAPAFQPAAWAQIEGAIERLDDERIADPRALETWRARLAELESKPAREWYEHQQLEATDTLSEQLDRALTRLANGLGDAKSALTERQASARGLGAERTAAPGDAAGRRLSGTGPGDGPATQTPATQRPGASERLRKLMRAMEASRLPLHPDLRRQLDSATESPAMSQQELEQLIARLEEGQRTALNMRSQSASRQLDEIAERVAGGPSDGERPTTQNRSAHGTGSGRGPGTAPLLIGEVKTAHDGKPEEVFGKEKAKAALGDPAGLSQSEHTVDPSEYRGPTRAGAIADRGRGGEATWSDSLSPDEQEYLKRWFR
ncbi:MAG: hypothetical protein HY791_27900 [Deltaproteobacteria bacterium]|nr:hypothetical protein [Deltaproteobacteria bacterium]